MNVPISTPASPPPRILPPSQTPMASTWQTLRERRLRLLNEDDCDLGGTVLIEDTNDSANRNDPSAMTSSQIIESRLREARQVISNSTNQRSIVLEFLLQSLLLLLRSLHTTQREIVAQTGSFGTSMPQVRLQLVQPSSAPLPPPPNRLIDAEDENLNGQPPFDHTSMLSRLTRLSQRTRDVMEDIDRRRTAVGMPPIRFSTPEHDTQPSNVEVDANSSCKLTFRRKVRQEERLLVQWSPDDLDVYGIRLPSLFEVPRTVIRRPGNELISR
ncbi:hypothetical protein CROQUDRAFT_60526 [Cronartium quercuum f. sp. fusiforme G11]|uniref:Uncharacterized protein n=1 Tax=Cronartium quercuum f. sp. fusiforme G11 TaxID=708437 RepID=A0A9P6TF36_9BASI|nr:hypothetical protein CROQUDRAFT_60526 [Cronartium quercuum f. sp. fusiforme G11]